MSLGRLHGVAGGSGSAGAARLSFGDASGGGLSNTPPATRNRDAFAGVDTLHVSVGAAFDGEAFEALSAACDEGKATASSGEVPADLVFGGHYYKVAETGAAGGYAWVLRSQGVTVLVQRRSEPKGQTPNVRVQFGAMACLAAGSLDALADDLASRLGGLGVLRVVFEKVSRVDWFVDLAGVRVSDVVADVMADRFVARGRQWSFHRSGRAWTGFSVGKGLRFRAYDKRLELRDQPIKWEAWSSAQWGGQVPDEVTRFEFQVDRESLKQWGVEGIAALCRKQSGIVEYLASKWFRITATVPTSGNEARAADSDAWRRVRRWLGSEFGRAEALDRQAVRGAADVVAYWRQVRGLAESVAALRGVRLDGFDDLVGFMVDQLCEDSRVSDGDVFARVKAKRERLEASASLGRVYTLRRADAFWGAA